MEEFPKNIFQAEGSRPENSEKKPYKMAFENITDKVEIGEILEKYFSKESDCDFIGQGDNKIYEGKPFVSNSFTQCTAAIAITPRTLSLSHIEPMNVRRGVWNNFKKFYPKEEPIHFLYVLGSDSYPNEIHHDLTSSNWTIAEVQALKLSQGENRDYWSIAVDPEIHCAYVKYGSGKKVVMKKIALPSDIYDKDLHEASRDLYESLDYMPPGFRDIQKKFQAENYSLTESGIIEEDQDFELTAKEWVQGGSDLKKQLMLFKDGEFLDIDMESQKPLSDILGPMVKGGKIVYLVRKFDYPPNEKYKGYTGFVFLYPLQRHIYRLSRKFQDE